MEINKNDWDICSDYLIKNLNFDIIYNSCAEESKQKFLKEDIILSIKKSIKEYPSHFDISLIGRIESKKSIFRFSIGYLNGYMYILNNKHNYYSYNWFVTIEKLFEIIEEHKKYKSYYLILNTKEYLRNLKIKKICQTLNHIK